MSKKTKKKNLKKAEEKIKKSKKNNEILENEEDYPNVKDYLGEIGYTRNECSFNAPLSLYEGKNQKLYEKEKKVCLFDERETWNLDVTSAEWMYCHLAMYRDVTNVNMSEYKVDTPYLVEIPEEKRKPVESNMKIAKKYYDVCVKRITVGEALDLAIEYFTVFLLNTEKCRKTADASLDAELSIRASENARCAFRIYAAIFDHMGW